MPPKKFCCCFDLRAGCIAIAWLQMMAITLIIAALAGYADMMTCLINAVVNHRIHILSDHFEIFYKSDNNRTDVNNFILLLISGIINLVTKIAIGILCVKAATCVAMTWGIIKRSHLCYQPWLFISGLEASVAAVAVLVFFILGFILNSIFFIVFIIYGVITALSWYFWICVYTVYQGDFIKQSLLASHELSTKI